MGIDFVRAARTAGHQMVATGRRLEAGEQAIATIQSCWQSSSTSPKY
jgi:hypothetical protein